MNQWQVWWALEHSGMSSIKLYITSQWVSDSPYHIKKFYNQTENDSSKWNSVY